MNWDGESTPTSPPVSETSIAEQSRSQDWIRFIRSRNGVIATSVFGLVLVMAIVLGAVQLLAQRSSTEASAARDRHFEQLLGAIESGEQVLEDEYKPTFESALDELNQAPIGNFSAARWASWESTGGILSFLRKTRAATSAASLGLVSSIARLESLPFSKEPSFDRARDLAVEHYNAWRTSISEVSDGLSQYFDPSSGAFFDDWPSMRSIPRILDNDSSIANQRIGPTFSSLCSALGDAQPSNGKFSAQIRDICDD